MNEFLDYIASLNPNYDLEGIKKAYETAEKMHKGQFRKSGEPYIIHPVETAKILAGLGMDEQTIIARIKEAAQFVDLDRLYLSPQCGFASCEIGNKLTEEEQWAKLALVKRIAEKVWK